MGKQSLEKRMRPFEYFNAMRALPDTWTILHMNGRGFSRLMAPRFAKPSATRIDDELPIRDDYRKAINEILRLYMQEALG